MFNDHGGIPQTCHDKIDDDKQAQFGSRLAIWIISHVTIKPRKCEKAKGKIGGHSKHADNAPLNQKRGPNVMAVARLKIKARRLALEIAPLGRELSTHDSLVSCKVECSHTRSKDWVTIIDFQCCKKDVVAI